MISSLIDRKARMPHGAARAIAATLQPGVEVIVEPNYLKSVQTAARNMGVKVSVRKFFRVGGWAYAMRLVQQTEVAS